MAGVHEDSIQDDKPCLRGRCGHTLLLFLTTANGLMAVTATIMRPNSSSWGPPKLKAHAQWEAAGIGSLALLAGWALVLLFRRFRCDRSIRIGGLVAIVHAMLWLMLPSWS